MGRRIARVLLWGGLLSGVLMLCGLALAVRRAAWWGPAIDLRRSMPGGPSGHAPVEFVSLRGLVTALWTDPSNPIVVITLGVVVLLTTPVLGVATAVPGFLGDGDRRYASIALIVLSMLLLSLLLAVGAG